MNSETMTMFLEHVQTLDKKVSLLLVDDSHFDLEIAKVKFREFGEKIETDSASGGDEALAMMQAKVYDVILLDVRMPSPDGIAVMIKMQELKINTPVALMTGIDNGLMIGQALKLGAVLHISKPLTLEHIKQLFAILKL